MVMRQLWIGVAGGHSDRDTRGAWWVAVKAPELEGPGTGTDTILWVRIAIEHGLQIRGGQVSIVKG